ncbi:Fe-S-binding domain-containing protein, partial [Candidatus Poribacteria bacterium]|nr:Fe-S-binding domain-containing protein [Candidatus Poribacteria bacterium]
MLLSWIIFLPLLGAIGIALVRNLGPSIVKGSALAVALITFIISLSLYAGFDANTSAMQFEEKREWIQGLGTSYHLGVDGLSLWLVLLTTFITPICVLAAWNSI